MDQQILDNLPQTRAEAADMLAKVAFARRMGFVKFAQGGWMQGVSDYFSNWQKADPQSFNTAMSGLTGAGIGGVGGAVQGMFDRRRRKSPLGSALSGAMMGGAIGAGGGAAYNYGPDIMKMLTEGTGDLPPEAVPSPDQQDMTGALTHMGYWPKKPSQWLPWNWSMFGESDPDKPAPNPLKVIPGGESLVNRPGLSALGTAAMGVPSELALKGRTARMQQMEDFLSGGADRLKSMKTKPGQALVEDPISKLVGDVSETSRKGFGLHKIKRGPKGVAGPAAPQAIPGVTSGPIGPDTSGPKLTGGTTDYSFSGRHAASVQLNNELTRLAAGNEADKLLATEIGQIINSGDADKARKILGRKSKALRYAGYMAIPALLMSAFTGGHKAEQKKYFDAATKAMQKQ